MGLLFFLFLFLIKQMIFHHSNQQSVVPYSKEDFYEAMENQNVDTKSDTHPVIGPDDVPSVGFPFRNVFGDDGKKLNIILICAPFREEKHEQQYEEYKSKGLYFSGISSYLEFPGKIMNPHDSFFHEERKHDYIKMVSTWLHCFRDPPENLKNSGMPMLLTTEADFKDTKNTYKYDPTIKKEYDFIYVCLDDQDPDKCEPGWNWHNRNWELAKKCLDIMCRRFKLRGVIMGRKNCEFSQYCAGIVKVQPFLPWNEFQEEMKKCRFIFIPNVSDASPRVITEAMCYNMPALVNYNIVGGWHNIHSGVTGEFFTSENDVAEALEKIIRVEKYTPRAWYEEHRTKEKSGKILADFFLEHYPNINNKNMKYAYPAI